MFGKHLVLRGARLRDDLRKRPVVIPIDGQGRIIVGFAGPHEYVFQSFPVHNCWPAGRIAKPAPTSWTFWRGPWSLLSDTSTAGKDYGPGIFGDIYPLSGLHLNVINSILTENLLSEQARTGTILAGLLFAALLLFPAARFRMRGFVLCWALLLYGLLASFFLALQLPPHRPCRRSSDPGLRIRAAGSGRSRPVARRARGSSAAKRCSWWPIGSSPRISMIWTWPISVCSISPSNPLRRRWMNQRRRRTVPFAPRR